MTQPLNGLLSKEDDVFTMRGQETQPNMSKQIMNVEWLIVVGYGEWPHEVHNDGSTVDVGAVLLQCDSQTKTAYH